MQNTPHIKTQSRQDQINTYLIQEQLHQAKVEFLAGDASFRKYYRLTLPQGDTVLLMDAPPPENPQAFIEIAQFLKNHHFSAPQILGKNMTEGFVLLEDFGDRTYSACLTLENTNDLYFLAIDTLIDLHTRITIKPDFLSLYSTELHLKEASLLIEWYFEAVYGFSLSHRAAEEYHSLWRTALSLTIHTPQSIVLRDYHVDNLMILEGRQGTERCGLLDFQDALWGSITYDIVSLLEDARRDVSLNLVESAWQRYGKAFPDLDLGHIRTAGTILSAARHAKIIGIFTRLAVRDRKPHYLKHISRVWHLLERCLMHPALKELKQWFDINFPERPIPHVP